ncbi:hypothetical protein INT45_013665 [Circinella minor]|uniref:Cellulase n=1 Tax=Circinella minor TaxID=1195481 RepID=A0A8H7S8D6_9FUNG|nr:hypothetical protein INT45_013665 [Circinella minor]
MKTTFLGLLAAVALVSAAPANSGSDECGALYSQCGGKGWKGTTCCVEGSKCTPQDGNEYYSQCLPAGSAEKPTTPTSKEPSKPTTPASTKPTTTTEVESETSTTTSAASETSSSSSSGYKAISGGASGEGQTTRYWDCCKASCSWPDKADVSAPVGTCKADGVTRLTDNNAQSGCNGGNAYMCNDNQPWAVSDDLSYGFAAASIAGKDEAGWCCGCYELTFSSAGIEGKKMVVQVTNTGGDLGSNHFDIQIPGGGVGIFNGCESQWNAPSSGWGERYGGLTDVSGCSDLPKELQDGCKWRFNWFKNANNPSVSFKEVTCPAELTKKTGCSRN